MRLTLLAMIYSFESTFPTDVASEVNMTHSQNGCNYENMVEKYWKIQPKDLLQPIIC